MAVVAVVVVLVMVLVMVVVAIVVVIVIEEVVVVVVMVMVLVVVVVVVVVVVMVVVVLVVALQKCVHCKTSNRSMKFECNQCVGLFTFCSWFHIITLKFMAKFDETAILLQSLLSKQRVVVSFNNAPTTYLITNLNHGFDCLMKTTTVYVITFLIVQCSRRCFKTFSFSLNY